MKKEPIRQQCENCKWWRVGDHSPKDIGNVGICVWMLPRTSDFSNHTKHAPFWAEDILHQTTSYMGKNCGTYEQAPPALRRKNTNRWPARQKPTEPVK